MKRFRTVCLQGKEFKRLKHLTIAERVDIITYMKTQIFVGRAKTVFDVVNNKYKNYVITNFMRHSLH